MGRLGLGLVLVLRLGLGLALGLQLGIGIGFRRNHSWSSTFTPRRNHSLCLSVITFSQIYTSFELISCFRDFLPRGSGIVTRRPLVLQLFYAKQGFLTLYKLIG